MYVEEQGIKIDSEYLPKFNIPNGQLEIVIRRTYNILAKRKWITRHKHIQKPLHINLKIGQNESYNKSEESTLAENI